MNESTRNRIAGLTFWTVVWFIGLAGLALASVPGSGNCAPATTDAAATAVYYSPAQTNTVFQDVDGGTTVHVRALRPVVAK
jgi:hypothetical protein